MRLAYLQARVDFRAPRVTALRRLRQLTGAARGQLAAYLDEVGPGTRLAEHMAAAEARYAREVVPPFALGGFGTSEGALLYALVRHLRPAAAIETGTASGVSTTYILAAMERNETGRLLSIDLPFRAGIEELEPVVPGTRIALRDSSPIPPAAEPGWIVPDDLRRRWQLRLGDARDLLAAALGELGPLGLFLHDSLHTYDHMRFELELAWPHVEAGGIVAADDVFFFPHGAALELARRAGVPLRIYRGVAYIRKP